MQVRDSEFGPAGQSDGTWADGVSLACRNSTVTDNTIVDATDGGIVVFGSPGSLIAYNTVRADRREMLGGINMVDTAGFDGDYTGTLVTGNVVDAAGRRIRIGLGMGPRVWRCDGATRPLRGATVTGNTLMGPYMVYGFAVDGVADWTVRGNVDLALHRGVAVNECGGRKASPPAGFQIDRRNSSGSFQSEFRDAHLEYALWAVD